MGNKPTTRKMDTDEAEFLPRSKLRGTPPQTPPNRTQKSRTQKWGESLLGAPKSYAVETERRGVEATVGGTDVLFEVAPRAAAQHLYCACFRPRWVFSR